MCTCWYIKIISILNFNLIELILRWRWCTGSVCCSHPSSVHQRLFLHTQSDVSDYRLVSRWFISKSAIVCVRSFFLHSLACFINLLVWSLRLKNTSQCSPAEDMKPPVTKYTECWSVGMSRLNAGQTEARPLSALIKELICWTLMLIGCWSAEDPHAGPSWGIKAAIWTSFLSWWVEIRDRTNPLSPLQLCSPPSVKESCKDTL